MNEFMCPNIDNDKLMKFILDLETKETSLQVSNAGGWHSKRLLEYADQSDEVNKLKETILFHSKNILGYEPAIAKSWANINRKGHYNKLHIHHKANLSVCYYITDISTLSGGEMVFLSRNGDEIKYAPTSGTLIMFPSDLMHKVLPHNNDIRITVACNLV